MKPYSFLLVALCSAAAWLAAVEGPVLIVNAASPVTDLPRQAVIDILSGNRRDWDAGGRINLLLPRENSPEMALLLAKVYRTDADGLKKLWTTLVFQNKLSAAPRSASSRVTVKAIEEDASAIGVVAGKDLSAGVRAVKIDGKGPDDADYLLK